MSTKCQQHRETPDFFELSRRKESSHPRKTYLLLTMGSPKGKAWLKGFLQRHAGLVEGEGDVCPIANDLLDQLKDEAEKNGIEVRLTE